MVNTEYTSDDYGRDFTMELKGDDDAKEKARNAYMLHRELIELSEILTDHTPTAYKEALESLENDEIVIIKEISKVDITDIDEYAPLDDFAEQKLYEGYERAVEVSNQTNSYEVKNQIQSALNSLKVALEF